MLKNSQSSPWQTALHAFWVMARWRTRILIRALLYQVLQTLHGKLGFVGGIILLAMFAPVVMRGFFETLPTTIAGLDGLILAGHIWLTATLSLMILAQFAKGFAKNPVQEPLSAHPAHFPTLARHRVIAAIPHTTVGFVGLFFAYFWQPLAARLNHICLAIPVHLMTMSMLVFATAIVIGGVGRKLLRWATRRGIRNSDILVNTSGGIAMTAFLVLLVTIIIVNKYAVGVLEALGNSVAVSYPIGMIPFAAALAADEGRWLTSTGWIGASALFALWAIRATHRWSFSAHREIPIDLATPVKRVFAPAFTGRSGRWLPVGLIVFWRKDIVVPYSREPKRYLFHQVNLLWWGIMAVILAMALRDSGKMSPALADTIPVLMTLLAMALVAMQNGVNALGREGKEVIWLRPIFTGSQLFGRKLLVNVAYVLAHGIIYAFVVSAASRATSLDTSFSTLAAYAVGAGTVFACMATAIGFLLPDFERKKSSLPGSTAVGKGGYLSGVLILIAITGAAHLLLTARILDGTTYAGLLGFTAICAAVSFVLIAASAIRQYRGLEI
jgi:hypothetical protein